jgi:peptidoglycan/xylan/chitin deacetylase (PgdA/CDA1 family)
MVLAYHRLGNGLECPYDRGVFSATAGQFEEQIRHFKSKFNVLELEEAWEFIERPERLKHFHLLLTFDDGYRDNYEIAFPILKSYGLQATFLLPTSFIGTRRLPWWDQIAYAIRSTSQPRIKLSYPSPLELILADTDREPVIGRVLRAYKSDQNRDPARFLSELASACDFPIPDNSSERVFMNWEEAARMIKGGMAIGSHTHRHEPLARLSPEDQFQELLQSRQVLQSQLGVPGDVLAFPVGSRKAFSSTTLAALEKAGYRLAFSFYGGLNYPRTMNRYNVLRIEPPQNFASLRFQTALVAAAGVEI